MGKFEYYLISLIFISFQTSDPKQFIFIFLGGHLKLDQAINYQKSADFSYNT